MTTLRVIPIPGTHLPFFERELRRAADTIAADRAMRDSAYGGLVPSDLIELGGAHQSYVVLIGCDEQAVADCAAMDGAAMMEVSRRTSGAKPTLRKPRSSWWTRFWGRGE